ncbi:MAG: hypothetical protein JWP78_3651 [Mucilaginibacter sp.]|nr:hypothetical protein [Mucilaginibacter sp.]
MQRIFALLVAAPYIFGPMARTHARIGPVINFAEGVDLYKKRIATEFKMVNRILQQLLFLQDRILLPLTLQINFALPLRIGI